MDRTPWEIVYADLFDREMPPQIESHGHGQLNGLREFWKKVLSEGIQPNGRRSFSDFSIKIGDDPIRVSVVMSPTGVNEELLKMRGWVEEDSGALDTIALHHAAWLDAFGREGTKKLLACASEANVAEDLECSW